MQTHAVAAAMNTEICGQCDSTAKVEDGVEHIQGDHGDGHAETVLYRRRNQVEQRQHGENRDKHSVVHYAGVAGARSCDHVAHQGHDEQRPEELESQGQWTVQTEVGSDRSLTSRPLKAVRRAFDAILV